MVEVEPAAEPFVELAGRGFPTDAIIGVGKSEREYAPGGSVLGDVHRATVPRALDVDTVDPVTEPALPRPGFRAVFESATEQGVEAEELLGLTFHGAWSGGARRAEEPSAPGYARALDCLSTRVLSALALEYFSTRVLTA